MLELGDATLLLDGEDLLLAQVQQGRDVAGVLIAELGDLVADADEGAQNALFAHDAGVVRGIGGGRHELGQSVDELASAGALERAVALELRAQRDDVDLLAAVVELHDGAEDQAMGVTVEVVGGEQLCDGGDGVGVDEHRAQH